MAVYTPVSDVEVTEFLQNYEIGDLISLTEITEGVENSNFLLRTSIDSYILTLYEKRINAEDLPFFMKLLSELSQNEISCPRPIPDKNGNTINICSSKYATIVSFLNGKTAQFTNLNRCSQIGTMLAKLHIATFKLNLYRKNPLGPENWLSILLETNDDDSNLPKGLNKEASLYIDNIITRWPKSLPAGIIHGDLFPNNAMFIDNNLSGIIDFYFACTDFYAYDIAICLNSWCFENDGSFNSEKAKTLIASYQKIRQLNNKEKNALPTLTQGAAIRFFVTRYYDWHHTPEGALVKKHDPLEYWNKIIYLRSNSNLELYGLP